MPTQYPNWYNPMPPIPWNGASPNYPTQNVMPQNQPTVSPIKGYFVNSESDILARDVPMDGTIAFFPYFDGSTVVGKRWNGNGQIETIYFARQDNTQNSDGSIQGTSLNPKFESMVLEKLTDIQNQMKHRTKPSRPQQERKENS